MSDTNTITEIKPKLAVPQAWKVVLHNDDYTPMDFVIGLLIDVFHKTVAEAVVLTQQVHDEGRGIAGVYTKEIAVTRAQHAMALAAQHQHPLRASAEPA